ncbi:MAG: hypothetical protein ACU841_09045 [Gammaproteobacteria bacterium]
MLESNTTLERGELSLLHASTCLSMTRFINGHHCPKLAQQIVQQLNRLLSHPELNPVSGSRDMYLQLLGHWQTITAQLLEQQGSRRKSTAYH